MCESARLAVVPVAVIYVVGLVLYRGAQALDAPPSLYIGHHPFLSIPVIVLAFQCHIQIVPIFAELGVAAPRREKKGRRNQDELGLMLLPDQGKSCICKLMESCFEKDKVLDWVGLNWMVVPDCCSICLEFGS